MLLQAAFRDNPCSETVPFVEDMLIFVGHEQLVHIISHFLYVNLTKGRLGRFSLSSNISFFEVIFILSVSNVSIFRCYYFVLGGIFYSNNHLTQSMINVK